MLAAVGLMIFLIVAHDLGNGSQGTGASRLVRPEVKYRLVFGGRGIIVRESSKMAMASSILRSSSASSDSW